MSTAEPSFMGRMGRFAVTSGIFLAIATAVLSLQGSLYRSAYLGTFGIDPLQFPIDSGGLELMIAHGWVGFSATVLENIGPGLFSMARETWWVLLLIVVMALSAPLWGTQFRKSPVSAATEPTGRLSALAEQIRATLRRPPMAWPWYGRLLGAVVMWIAGPVTIALALVMIAVVALFGLMMVAGPFESVGERSALQFCAKDPGSIAWAEYQSAGAGEPIQAPLIECGGTYCAVIPERHVEVLLASRLIRVVPGAVIDSTKVDAARAGASFCPASLDKPLKRILRDEKP
ncbi:MULTISPECIES: hypothetical protein [Stenotrophomonas]|uniref:hypothetical protein n=1 Tax=Stenotrophomonas TaxID=40323 RepID=UPI0010DB5219|nr:MULTISPECIES: hypothetical protein [Stenotrophomonas]MBH1462811.1 hypothetical protein [Stenotrophomonas maltophilia]MCU1052164.1 hypothetical protein [Stenotrophomonas maltophilia]MDH0190477.1 hypothetical protein [Stenotrophomonas sp. GD04051]MDH0463907.1 hypothetical protein [Stenotrophomonas sp. GD03993]MDH0876744.1 hypothetical protein [Stenotrophomonas sp. GD03877]